MLLFPRVHAAVACIFSGNSPVNTDTSPVNTDMSPIDCRQQGY